MAKHSERDFKRDPHVSPIPTPEEEALEDLRTQDNKRANRTMMALLLFVGSAFFHAEIEAGMRNILRLFT
jgi:hypothetical protein